jgi:hypothetical protein
MKINTLRLKKIIQQGLEDCAGPFWGSECCIGKTADGIQIHLNVTRDPDSIEEMHDEHVCVTDI